jgi:hypothetical protein
VKAILFTLFLISLCSCKADEGVFPEEGKAKPDPWEITEPINEIYTLVVAEGEIEFPSQTLSERVKLINNHLNIRRFAGRPKVVIGADVEANNIICEPFSLKRPTLGQILKYTLSNRTICATVNGHEVKIAKCGAK